MRLQHYTQMMNSLMWLHDDPPALELQMAGAGFTFVEVLTMCPTGWFVPTASGPEYLEDSMMETFGIGELKTPEGEVRPVGAS